MNEVFSTCALARLTVDQNTSNCVELRLTALRL
jgi:hypothetical protein